MPKKSVIFANTCCYNNTVLTPLKLRNYIYCVILATTLGRILYVMYVILSDKLHVPLLAYQLFQIIE